MITSIFPINTDCRDYPFLYLEDFFNTEISLSCDIFAVHDPKVFNALLISFVVLTLI